MSVTPWEEWLTELSGGASMVGTLEGRMAVAMAFGYMDARTMVHLMQTHGLPLSMQAIKIKDQGLKVDFSGLEHELVMIGKKPSTIASEIKELRYFMENAA